jgi:DeoR family transcriptional regulator, suf operon transcriptional repressor
LSGIKIAVIMKSTREKILRTLLAFPGSTINDLAESVGINGISIRHHLTALEAEDLVSSEEERHGVGRPRLIYTLTEKGVEQFPTSYLRLTKRVLMALKDRLGSVEFEAIFKEIGGDIADQYQEEFNGKNLKERITFLKSVLTREGFIIESRQNDSFYELTSLSCPYYRIGLAHPEICALDYTLVSKIVARDVKIISCILQDADRCVYQITKQKEED